MGTRFWIRRYVSVLAGAFVVITVAQLLRGRATDVATSHAAQWSVISASVFTAMRYVQARRGQHCAICRDTPEMRREMRPEVQEDPR